MALIIAAPKGAIINHGTTANHGTCTRQSHADATPHLSWPWLTRCNRKTDAGGYKKREFGFIVFDITFRDSISISPLAFSPLLATLIDHLITWRWVAPWSHCRSDAARWKLRESSFDFCLLFLSTFFLHLLSSIAGSYYPHCWQGKQGDGSAKWTAAPQTK